MKPISDKEKLELQNIIVGGSYRHYKGNLYTVLNVARHSETLELMVIYRAEYESDLGNNVIWSRPLSMFLEKLENKPHQNRFELIQKQ